MEDKERIKIKANYSFWRHPIKWLKERKHRAVLEHMMNFHYQNGGKEEIEKKIKEMMIFGTSVTKYF
jgi:hypothetical protein